MGGGLIVLRLPGCLHPDETDLVLGIVNQVVLGVLIQHLLVKLHRLRPLLLSFPGQAARKSGQGSVGSKGRHADDRFVDFDHLVHVGRHGDFPQHLGLSGEKDVADGEHPFNGQIPVLVGGRFFHQFFVSLVSVPVAGQMLEHLPDLVLGLVFPEIIRIILGKILVNFEGLFEILQGVGIRISAPFFGFLPQAPGLLFPFLAQFP